MSIYALYASVASVSLLRTIPKSDPFQRRIGFASTSLQNVAISKHRRETRIDRLPIRRLFRAVPTRVASIDRSIDADRSVVGITWYDHTTIMRALAATLERFCSSLRSRGSPIALSLSMTKMMMMNLFVRLHDRAFHFKYIVHGNNIRPPAPIMPPMPIFRVHAQQQCESAAFGLSGGKRLLKTKKEETKHQARALH
jgi:hypothetical protein